MAKDTNSGYGNSGNGNSGNGNSGYRNSGNGNSGNRNSGNWNSGNWNSGDWNSGYGNSGNRNSGDWNSGNGNSGNGNSGDRNSGNGNSGNRNSGDWNSGYGNSGYGNSTYRSSGIFCSEEPTVIMFNKESGKKWDEIDHPHFNEFWLNKWIEFKDLTAIEKKENPRAVTCEGLLRTWTYKEAWANFWRDTDETNRKKFLALPNFDAAIFKEITGVDVGENTKKGELLKKADELIQKAKELQEQATNL